MNSSIHFFVYGTLKRRQCRASLWPCPPESVTIGFVRGRLYDLGPYPALRRGDDWVCGEVWRFPPESADAIRHTLDEIEVYQQPGEPDLYVREFVAAHTRPGAERALNAETYFYVDESMLTAARYIRPVGGSAAAIPYAQWPVQPASS